MQESTALAPTQETALPLAVEMRNITKTWPGVVANDHVNLEVRKGEIHALVGENGAGKSTLMNILYGLIHPDSGEIFINGKLVHITGPRDAIRLGIGMVHQHFMLIPPLTVAENIVLGHEPGGKQHLAVDWNSRCSEHPVSYETAASRRVHDSFAAPPT